MTVLGDITITNDGAAILIEIDVPRIESSFPTVQV